MHPFHAVAGVLKFSLAYALTWSTIDCHWSAVPVKLSPKASMVSAPARAAAVGADLRLSPFVVCIAEVDDDRQDAERNDEEDRGKDQDDASLIVCTSNRDHGAAAETVHHDQSAPVGGVSSPPVSVLL